MSDDATGGDADVGDATATLADAIEDDPEAVAELVRHLDAETGDWDGDEDLDAALSTLADLQRTGTLDDLASLATTLSLVSEALDDEMVTSLAGTGSALGGVASEAADPDAARGLQTLLRGVANAGEAEPRLGRVGPLGLVRALNDPEVQTGLAFLVALARGVGTEVERGREE